MLRRNVPGARHRNIAGTEAETAVTGQKSTLEEGVGTLHCLGKRTCGAEQPTQ